MTDDHGFPEKAPGWPYRRVEDADIAILAMKRLETFEETLQGIGLAKPRNPTGHVDTIEGRRNSVVGQCVVVYSVI